jgi:hypothetical protein
MVAAIGAAGGADDFPSVAAAITLEFAVDPVGDFGEFFVEGLFHSLRVRKGRFRDECLHAGWLKPVEPLLFSATTCYGRQPELG